MKRACVSLMILILLMPSACSPALEPDTTPTSTPSLQPSATPTPSPSPSPSPTPPPDVEFTDLRLLPDKQVGDWRVIGLITNRSASPMIDPRVAITLMSNDGAPLVTETVPIIFAHLAPGESSPFRAVFPSVGLASDIRVALHSNHEGSIQRAALEVDILNTGRTSRGSVAILGSITNPGNDPVSITALALTAQDSSRRALGVALPYAMPGSMRGGESAPFLALLEIDAGASSYAAYVDAVAARGILDPQPISLDGSPRLKLDSQDHPIAIGSLKNVSDNAYLASLTLTISYQNEWVSVSQIDTPIPLGPGEKRAFSMTEFPGMDAILQDAAWSLEDLHLDVRIDPTLVGSEVTQAIPVELEILSYERIGTFTFIRGTVTNPYTHRVYNATVMTSLRYDWGYLMTAAWVVAAETLSTGESADFVLAIPIPANSTPRYAEFDTWAAAVQNPADGSPPMQLP
ncbi:MAG TPA: hypothetical protein G4O08_13310 [Anaerolineae bacterium]|nr:hypothetical protein [Anaerolineae bacterium]